MPPWRIGRLPAALALCAALAACSSGSSGPNQPSSPNAAATPAGSFSPTVRDGTTEQPVAAHIEPPGARIGSRISVTAPGFLTRDQLLEAADIFLWPGESGYIKEVAYTEFTDGTFRTIRWNEPFTISLDPEIANDPAIVARAEQVAAEASRHIGFAVRVGPGGAVTVGVDESLEEKDAVGQATVSYRGATIVGARVVFWRGFEIAGGAQAQYSNTFLHEMGHVIGLGHSPRVTDVMTPGGGPGTRQSAYQPGEVSCLHMSYAHRRPGNFFPDRDPALAAASAARPRTTVFVDRLTR